MTAKGSNAEHSQLVEDVLLAIGGLKDVRAWKQIVGNFQRARWNDHGKVESVITVKVGVDGQADVSGIFTCACGHGDRLEMECKTGQATQNADQKRWEKMIVSRGGKYFVVRSAAEALEIIVRERAKGCTHAGARQGATVTGKHDARLPLFETGGSDGL